MTQAKTGDTVRIHYTGTLTDGSTFDSSEGRDPLEFTVGSGQIIPGLDAALPGMEEGEKKTVEVPADEAYGQPDPNAKQAVPRADIPEDIPLDIGTQLQVQTPQGQVMPVTVAEKPHCGCCGVPFINSTTSLAAISDSIRERTWSSRDISVSLET